MRDDVRPRPAAAAGRLWLRLALSSATVAVALGAGSCRNPMQDDSPDPRDPKVKYIEGSRQDPRLCERVRFLCAPGHVPFSNRCGCGCIQQES